MKMIELTKSKTIKSKIEDDINHILKKEDDLNFLQIEDDLKKIM